MLIEGLRPLFYFKPRASWPWAFCVPAQRQGEPIKKEQGAGRKVNIERAQGAGQGRKVKIKLVLPAQSASI